MFNNKHKSMFNKDKRMMIASFLGTTAAALSAIISPKKQGIINEMMERSNHFADKAKLVTDNVYEGIKTLTSKRMPVNNFFMTGAVLGALIGAGSTFLLTPRTGKQVRNHISKRYQDLADRAQETIDAITPSTNPIHRHASKSIHNRSTSRHAKKAISHAKKAVSHAKSAVSRTIKKAKARIS